MIEILLNYGMQIIVLLFGTGGIVWALLERKDKVKKVKKEVEKITAEVNITATQAIKGIEETYVIMINNVKKQLTDGAEEIEKQRKIDSAYLSTLKQKCETLNNELEQTKVLVKNLKDEISEINIEKKEILKKYNELKTKYNELKKLQENLNK